MRKKLLGLLCACMLLSGCSVGSAPTAPTAPTEPTTTEAPIEDTPVTVPQGSHTPLLEQGISLEESSNLRYIPNQTVEDMVSPEVRLFGNGLLLNECVGNEIVLKHISLEDGALVAEGSVPATSGAKLFIGSGEIGICDREFGQISILDEEFRPLRAYDVPGEGDEWYLNSELEILYIFFSDRGLLARNLVTREDLWLVENGFRVTPIGSANGYVIFEYTDRADQKTHTRCLNLSMATLETLPVGGSIAAGSRQGDTWLVRANEPEGSYMLVQNETVNAVNWEGFEVRLLSPKRHLLAMDLSGRNLSLFESDGSFLSQCILPVSSHAVVGLDFVWSGYWEGYFFTDYFDGTCRLMFWDVDAECEGEDLQMVPLGETQQSQPVVEAFLYERAAQLSQRFGVDIRIAEQCSLDYSHHEAYELTDPTFIRSSLDILEQSLSRYPEGFFRQLTYGSVESIRIELVGIISVKPGVTRYSDYPDAFAQDRGSYYGIVANGYMLQESIVFHEFSHIIDSRLEWDSFIRSDALYSEEAWLALQPEGFEYAMSYTNIPAQLQSFMDSDYFMSAYALTYPTEDRATLLAAAMECYTWDFEPGTGRRAKMQYYADCIRDCFDTTGWPEITYWEQALK